MVTTYIRKYLYDAVLRLRGTKMYEVLGSLEGTQYLSATELNMLQEALLLKVVDTARSETQFYAAYPRLDPADPKTALERLPLLGKADLIARADDLKVGGRHLLPFKKTTGGSTGQPVTVLKDRLSFGAEIAAAWRGLAWAGIRPGQRQVRFWGVPGDQLGRIKASLVDFIGNRIRVSAFDFDEDSFRKVVPRIRDFNPHYFYGYVSVLREFAGYLDRVGGNNGIRPNAIVTTAEILDPGTRGLLQQTFGCKVFEEYGCGELGTIAHECERGSLHVNAENLLLELIPTEEGEAGLSEFVVTDLKNSLMPLIRYRLGDLGEMGDDLCECGRSLPVIKRVVGRAYDVLVNAAGKRFHPEFFIYIFEDAKKAGISCLGFQVEQTQIDRLRVRFQAPVSDVHALKEVFGRRIGANFGTDVHVDYEIVDYLPREASGKMRVVKSSASLAGR